MTSKEALERISWRYVNDPSFQEWCNIIKQDIERVEKLEKAVEILKGKFLLELSASASVVKEKYCYLLKFLYNYQYFTITKEQYELLKEVLYNDK